MYTNYLLWLQLFVMLRSVAVHLGISAAEPKCRSAEVPQCRIAGTAKTKSPI